MFKLLHNCTHLTCWQGNTQNSSSQASTLCELWISRYSSWIYKRQRNQRSNCQHPLDHQKSKRVPEKHLLLLYWLCQSLWLCGPQQTLENFLKEMGIPDHLTCLLRNLYAGQEVTVRTGGTTDWFLIGKGVRQGCILSPCLLNLYAEYIMQNAGPWLTSWNQDCWRNINNLRYADDTTLLAESEEEWKSLLMKAKEKR